MTQVRVSIVALGITFLGALAPPPVAAAGDPAVVVLQSLFAAPDDAERFCSADFSAQLPPATLGRYVAFYERAIGVPTDVTKNGDSYTLTAPHGSLRASIELDAAGKIAALRFHDELSAANGDALRRVLAAPALSTAWFAPTASRDAAVARTGKIVSDLHDALGAFTRVETRFGAYVAVFERGETHAQISTDRSGRIVYLSFERPSATIMR